MGEPTMIAIGNPFEGGYLVRRAGYWYLFASSADCCAGLTTGYRNAGRCSGLQAGDEGPRGSARQGAGVS
ncbi:hypothetical protein GCM10027187_71090 [Streptosporangium sandarakinum]|uniref:Uncharacterized protein n=1 Tax=Streptosporangium sandarakinum TaxID=1260955 RepID=A0A852V6L8_9ACTN|nr:hypothetical protein [Streptosporangium sandarakinum]NYF43750.1 hypothetical protein [Streptosporangium sandarakinum]